MASLFERIFDDPSKFTFITENLGECKVDSPVKNTNFVEEDDMSRQLRPGVRQEVWGRAQA